MADSLQITIRQGQPADLTELQQLFADTVSTICKADYNDEQLKVWMSGIENKERWQDLLQNQFLLVALNKEKIIGFCSLDRGNYIDFLYVHKNYQGQGVARRLYTDIEEEAKRQGQTFLTSDVSKTARRFFEKSGFNVLTEQTVVRKGVTFNNFKMRKDLSNDGT